MWSEIRDGISAYETQKSFSGKVVLEEFVLAVIIGVMTHSLWAGVITFLTAGFLFALPVIGTILIFVFSGIYGAAAYGLLSLLCVPSALCFGVAALIFMASIGAHIATVGH